ncbi:sugar transporter [Kockovaella imperatae]|uniref:Sugar transporter n=1 Tax=Kockovaella imperatae TaxID=4999 RepID=A0A1Y1U7P4_9TREE|nr:sugar transporter [Kockovaella imperatae]ORX34051.1 sugar transporter [Kockovaella imperatae]
MVPEADATIDSGGAKQDAFSRGQVATGFERLTVFQTVAKFKMCFAVCFAATFAGATDGYQIGINGNIIANPGFVKQFATATTAAGEPALSAPVLSAIGTIQSVGQIIGMTTMPFLATRYGRKAAMYALWFVLLCSVTCEAVAKRWQVWFVAKLFSGIGVGSLQFITPTYVTEVAPTRVRGFLLMMYNFWFSVGNTFAPVALQVMSTYAPNEFRIPIYTQYAQIGLMLIIYLIIPESPMWCASRDLEDRAKRNLRVLYRGVTDFDVDYQYQVLAQTVTHEKEEAILNRHTKWYSIFKGQHLRRTIASTWALTAQQVLGLTLFYTYSSYFFKTAGIADPFAVTCLTNGIQLVIIWIVAASVDYVGRRNICCGGLTIMLVAVTLIGILGVVKETAASNKLLVFFSCIYIVGLQCSGSTGWGFVGELSSQSLRPYTAGFAAAISCVGGVIMNVLVPYMLNPTAWNWGLKTAFFYTGIGAPAAVGAWFIIPEPKGLSAAELDELFENKVKAWRFSKTKTALQRQLEITAA